MGVEDVALDTREVSPAGARVGTGLGIAVGALVSP
jgi:hypothetical protein